MNDSIRTKRHHHIRLVKLEAGYREQRGWLSVGMSKITVTLALYPWLERPLVVTYVDTQADRTITIHEQSFERNQLADARKLFTTAGLPNEWPNTESVQTLNAERSSK